MISIWFENRVVKPETVYDKSIKTLVLLKDSLLKSCEVTLTLGLLSLLLSPCDMSYVSMLASIFTVTFVLYYSIHYIKRVL